MTYKGTEIVKGVEINMCVQLRGDGKCLYVISGKYPMLYISDTPLTLAVQLQTGALNTWTPCNLGEFRDRYEESCIIFDKFDTQNA